MLYVYPWHQGTINHYFQVGASFYIVKQDNYYTDLQCVFPKTHRIPSNQSHSGEEISITITKSCLLKTGLLCYLLLKYPQTAPNFITIGAGKHNWMESKYAFEMNWGQSRDRESRHVTAAVVHSSLVQILLFEEPSLTLGKVHCLRAVLWSIQ